MKRARKKFRDHVLHPPQFAGFKRPLPVLGSTRVIERFLWLPKIGRCSRGRCEIRWLCRARWTQIYCVLYDGEDTVGWADIGLFL